MRKFLCKGTALVLALALVCGAAAVAETMEEFCEGFNAFLPGFFEGMDMDEESVESLTQIFWLSHSANVSDSSGSVMFSAKRNLLTVMTLEGDDPSRGISICATGDTDEIKETVAWVFLLYFAEHYDLPSGNVNGLLDRILENSGSGSAGTFGGYSVTYTNADKFVSILLMK